MTDPAPGKALVLFDGDCQLCQRSVAVLKRLDWLGRLHFRSARDDPPPAKVGLRRDRMLAEMHLLPPGRDRAFVGFEAFRWLAWRLPLLAPVAPLLYLPGVPWVGRRAYLWVARNRFDLVPCHDGQCQVKVRPRV